MPCRLVVFRPRAGLGPAAREPRRPAAQQEVADHAAGARAGPGPAREQLQGSLRAVLLVLALTGWPVAVLNSGRGLTRKPGLASEAGHAAVWALPVSLRSGLPGPPEAVTVTIGFELARAIDGTRRLIIQLSD